MLGTFLGPYQLLEELGSGGMAAVYRAHQANMGRDVAVKVIYQELADEAGREQFQREARLIARLEHPHILPVHDFDGQSHPPYIVMRYLGGGTLKDVLHQHPGTEKGHWRWHLRWLTQVAEALDYAHRQGIVHRDLKPSNIILDTEKNAFLADFGIAGLVEDLARDGIDSSMTGTPFYCSPEQALGQAEISAPADLYALAVVAFEMFSHTLPFTAGSFEELLAHHAHTPPPAISQHNPTIPKLVDAVFIRALAKKPAERYPAATAFVEALGLAFGITLTRAQTTDAPDSAVEQNKTITALYVEAKEYARLVDEQAGPETAQRALHTLWEQVAQLVPTYAGQLLLQTEKQALAVWGAAATREDDAEHAVRAALDVQTALRKLGAAYFTETEDEPLPLNLGVHTGLALLTPTSTPGQFTASGLTLALAEKLADHAEGRLLISHDTYREVHGIFDVNPAEPIKVRGRKELLETYQVNAAKPRAFRLRAQGVEGLEIRLIGREAEFKQLQSAYLSACEESETQMVTLLGEAGVGKSRLLAEFDHWFEMRPEDCWWFVGRATPATTQRPYALWREVLSFRFEIFDDDPLPTVQAKLEQGVANLLLPTPLPTPMALPTELREMAHLMGYLAGFDLRASPHISGLLGDRKQLTTRARQLTVRFFTQLSRTGPALIVLEDLHYADDASLDLFSEVVTSQPNQPLLLLGCARPNFLERRPAWGNGLPTHIRLTLAPFDKRTSRDLARALLQKIPDPPKTLRDLLVDRAEGNPRFMEELLKMLIEDRVILKDTEAWRVEESRLNQRRVPPSLVGVLQARLDTLLYPEKLTLQRAAVFGRVFADNMLAALDAADATRLPDLAGCLRLLEQRGFIQRRETVTFAGCTDYAFTQGLLRDLIYATLLERQRHTYHTACAAWLAQTERATELLPLIADHYEKANQPAQAALYLERAGDKASQVSSFAEAAQFYTQAQSLTSLMHQAPLSIKLAETHYHLSDFAAARADIHKAQLAAQTDSERAAALALLGEMTSELGDYAQAQTILAEAVPLARANQDQATLCRVLYALGDVNWRLGKLPEAHAALEESLALARALGDVNRELFALNRLGTAIPFEEMAARERLYKEVYARAVAVGNRERAMVALNNLGANADDANDFEAARDYLQQALTLAREIGAQQSATLYLLNLAGIEILLGELEPARAALREGLMLAQRLGSPPRVAQAVRYYANLAHAEGHTDRALALWGLVQRQPSWSSDNQHELEMTFARWGLEAATIQAGLAHGATLAWETTIEALLQE